MKRSIITVLVLCSFLFLAARVYETDDGVVFEHDVSSAGRVSVAGEFNGWDMNANLMQKNENGVWSVTIKLPVGSYAYKFVVDGNWTVDSDNSEKVDDGYGGSNSLATVTGSASASVVPGKAKPIQIKSPIPSGVNPKVFFDGRYYTLYEMRKDDDMTRYSLDKPYHDLNLGITVKLNDNVKGYTLLNANNTREGVDMWKTHLNFRRTWMEFDAEYFELFAFDDFGSITFDDPLGLVGKEGYKSYGFGWDYRGILCKTDEKKLKLDEVLPFKMNLTAFGADYQGTDERDIIASRLKLEYPFEILDYDQTLSLGGGWYNSKDDEQDVNSVNTEPIYIVDSNPAWEIDGELETSLQDLNWQDPLKMHVGYEHLEYKNLKEYKNYGEENYDFIVEEDFTWQEGRNDYLYFNVIFPAALKLEMAYTLNEFDITYENYFDTVATIPPADTDTATMSRSKWTINSDFEIDDLSFSAGFSRWSTDYPDSLLSWNEYFRYLERIDGNGKWYQDYSELKFANYLLLGYDTGLLWHLQAKGKFFDFALDYEANIAQRDFNYKPELIENFFRASWMINSKWTLSHDLRVPLYNSDFLEIKTDFGEDEDVFAAGYTEIRYKLADNIQLSIGYGVNPRLVDSVSDEFTYDGRRQYLEEEGNMDEYLQSTYNGFGDKLRQAESALEDDNRISIEAVLQF